MGTLALLIWVLSNSDAGGFGGFLLGIIILYFTPLFYGLLKKLFSITLKSLQYLKMITNK